MVDVAPTARPFVHQQPFNMSVQAGDTPVTLPRKTRKRLLALLERFSKQDSCPDPSLQAPPIPWRSDDRPSKRHVMNVSTWPPEARRCLLSTILFDLVIGAMVAPRVEPRASSFFFVTMSAGKPRFVVDPQEVNDLSEPSSVALPRPADPFSPRGRPRPRIAVKWDLKAAYKFVKLDPSDVQFLGIEIEGAPPLVFTALPFGLTHAPKFFVDALTSVLALHLQHRIRFGNVCHYVDDILIFANTLETLISAMEEVWLAVAPVFWLSAKKAFSAPCSAITFLGVRLDFEAVAITVVPEKVDKLQVLFDEARGSLNTRPRHAAKLLAKALGLATFMSLASPLIGLTRYPLFQLITVWTQQPIQEAMSLTDELWPWSTFTLDMATRAVAPPPRQWSPEEPRFPITITVDSSDTASGILIQFQDVFRSFQVPLPESLRSLASGIRELAGAEVALRILAPICSKFPVTVSLTMDATAAVAMISRWRSPSTVARDLLRSILSQLQASDTHLHVSWCNRDSGMLPIADAFSRLSHIEVMRWPGQLDMHNQSPTDYRLAPTVLAALKQIMPWSLDVFASPANTTADAYYYSRVPPDHVAQYLNGLATSLLESKCHFSLRGWRGDARAADISGQPALIFPPWSELDTAVRIWKTAQPGSSAWFIIKQDSTSAKYIEELNPWTTNVFDLRQAFSASCLLHPDGSPTPRPPPWPLLALQLVKPGSTRRDDGALIKALLALSGSVHPNPGPSMFPPIADVSASRRLVCPPAWDATAQPLLAIRLVKEGSMHQDDGQLVSALLALSGDIHPNPGPLFPRVVETSVPAADREVRPAAWDGQAPMALTTWIAKAIDYLVNHGPPALPLGLHGALAPAFLSVVAAVRDTRSLAARKDVKGTLDRVLQMLDQTIPPLIAPSIPFSMTNLSAVLLIYAHARLGPQRTRFTKWRQCRARRVADEISALKSTLQEAHFLPVETPAYFGPTLQAYLKCRGAFIKVRHSKHLPIHAADLMLWKKRHGNQCSSEVDLLWDALLLSSMSGLRAGSVIKLKGDMFTPFLDGWLLRFSARSKTVRGDRMVSDEAQAVKAIEAITAVAHPMVVTMISRRMSGGNPHDLLFLGVTVDKLSKFTKQIVDDLQLKQVHGDYPWVIGAHGCRVAFAAELDSIGVPSDLQNVLCWWARDSSSQFYYRGVNFADVFAALKLIGTTSFVHSAPGNYLPLWESPVTFVPSTSAAVSIPVADKLPPLAALEEDEDSHDHTADDEDVLEEDAESDDELDLNGSDPFKIGAHLFLCAPSGVYPVQVTRAADPWYIVVDDIGKSDYVIAHKSQLRSSHTFLSDNDAWLLFDSWSESACDRACWWVSRSKLKPLTDFLANPSMDGISASSSLPSNKVSMVQCQKGQLL